MYLMSSITFLLFIYFISKCAVISTAVINKLWSDLLFVSCGSVGFMKISDGKMLWRTHACFSSEPITKNKIKKTTTTEKSNMNTIQAGNFTPKLHIKVVHLSVVKEF